MTESNGNKTINADAISLKLGELENDIQQFTIDIAAAIRRRAQLIHTADTLRQLLDPEWQKEVGLNDLYDEPVNESLRLAGLDAARKARSQFVETIAPKAEVEGFVERKEAVPRLYDHTPFAKTALVKIGAGERPIPNINPNAVYTTNQLALMIGPNFPVQRNRIAAARTAKKLKFKEQGGNKITYKGSDVLRWLKAEEKGGKR